MFAFTATAGHFPQISLAPDSIQINNVFVIEMRARNVLLSSASVSKRARICNVKSKGTTESAQYTDAPHIGK